MDEIKKAYYDELKEKSSLARSAKLGAYRPKCSKRYTRKELEAMNGPTYTVNLNRFYPYEEFKVLPEDLKKEYLQHLIDTWHVGPKAFAEMWGITTGTMCPFMKRIGVKTHGLKTSVTTKEKFFSEFVRAVPKTDPPSEVPTNKMTFCNGSLTFVGLPDMNAIISSLMAIAPTGVPLKITVAFESAE